MEIKADAQADLPEFCIKYGDLAAPALGKTQKVIFFAILRFAITIFGEVPTSGGNGLKTGGVIVQRAPPQDQVYQISTRLQYYGFKLL